MDSNGRRQWKTIISSHFLCATLQCTWLVSCYVRDPASCETYLTAGGLTSRPDSLDLRDNIVATVGRCEPDSEEPKGHPVTPAPTPTNPFMFQITSPVRRWAEVQLLLDDLALISCKLSF